ncbi:hypothetical protein AGMMS50267_16010 [Spirochaetia bacterium]|nr:hypothetical protein AGMMS50267_16010 [Spirochaetia bacterium]
MGDVGRGFYVKPGIPEIFKDQVVPLADIVTPNQFELEALTRMNTASLTDARKAIDRLHAMGPKVVLVTSFLGNDAPPGSYRYAGLQWLIGIPDQNPGASAGAGYGRLRGRYRRPVPVPVPRIR